MERMTSPRALPTGPLFSQASRDDSDFDYRLSQDFHSQRSSQNLQLEPNPFQLARGSEGKPDSFLGSISVYDDAPANLERLCSACHESPCQRHIFPFLSLPTEIRLHIYRLALSRDTPVLLRAQRPAPEEEKEDVSEYDPSKVAPKPQALDFTSPVLRARTGQGVAALAERASIERAHYRARARVRVAPRPKSRDRWLNQYKPHEQALTPQLLVACKQVLREARPVLYSENTFTLKLESAVRTIMSLKQPSRSLIKHISLTVPSFHDILEGFADLVRLGLRYCWGLQTFTIALPTFVPEDRYTLSTGTNVYANAFHILRWLPQETKVILDGGATDEIRKIVEENTKMAENLDKVWHHLVRYPDDYFDWT